jgi:hypothetical protein
VRRGDAGERARASVRAGRCHRPRATRIVRAAEPKGGRAGEGGGGREAWQLETGGMDGVWGTGRGTGGSGSLSSSERRGYHLLLLNGAERRRGSDRILTGGNRTPAPQSGSIG